MLIATCVECGNMQEFAFIFVFPFEKSLLPEVFHKMFFFTFVSTLSFHTVNNRRVGMKSYSLHLCCLEYYLILEQFISNCLFNKLNELSAQPPDGNTVVHVEV